MVDSGTKKSYTRFKEWETFDEANEESSKFNGEATEVKEDFALTRISDGSFLPSSGTSTVSNTTIQTHVESSKSDAQTTENSVAKFSGKPSLASSTDSNIPFEKLSEENQVEHDRDWKVTPLSTSTESGTPHLNGFIHVATDHDQKTAVDGTDLPQIDRLVSTSSNTSDVFINDSKVTTNAAESSVGFRYSKFKDLEDSSTWTKFDEDNTNVFPSLSSHEACNEELPSRTENEFKEKENGGDVSVETPKINMADSDCLITDTCSLKPEEESDSFVTKQHGSSKELIGSIHTPSLNVTSTKMELNCDGTKLFGDIFSEQVATIQNADVQSSPANVNDLRHKWINFDEKIESTAGSSVGKAGKDRVDATCGVIQSPDLQKTGTNVLRDISIDIPSVSSSETCPRTVSASSPSMKPGWVTFGEEASVQPTVTTPRQNQADIITQAPLPSPSSPSWVIFHEEKPALNLQNQSMLSQSPLQTSPVLPLHSPLTPTLSPSVYAPYSKQLTVQTSTNPFLADIATQSVQGSNLSPQMPVLPSQTTMQALPVANIHAAPQQTSPVFFPVPSSTSAPVFHTHSPTTIVSKQATSFPTTAVISLPAPLVTTSPSKSSPAPDPLPETEKPSLELEEMSCSDPQLAMQSETSSPDSPLLGEKLGFGTPESPPPVSTVGIPPREVPEVLRPKPVPAKMPDLNIGDKALNKVNGGTLDEFPEPSLETTWNVLLRYPDRKKKIGPRSWKNVVIKISGSILQIFEEYELSTPYREVPLQAYFTFQERFLQSHGNQKVHVAKLEYVKYKESREVKSKLHYEHLPAATTIVKVATPNFAVLREYKEAVINAIRFLPYYRDRGITYRYNEVFLDVDDQCRVIVNSDGSVLKCAIQTQIKVKAFLTGDPECQLILNDVSNKEEEESRLREEDKPQRIPKWIEPLDPDFHKCSDAEKFQQGKRIFFHPLDACKFELMRFRVRSTKEVPLHVKAMLVMQHEERIELRAEIKLCSDSKMVKYHRNNIMLRFPIPDSWVPLFRMGKMFGREQSIKSKIGTKAAGIKSRLKHSKCSIAVSLGTAMYEPEYSAVVWRVDQMPVLNSKVPVDAPQTFLCRLDLPRGIEYPEDYQPHAEVEYEVPYTVASDTNIVAVKVDNQVIPEKWVLVACGSSSLIDVYTNFGYKAFSLTFV